MNPRPVTTRDFCLVCGKWVDEHDPEERVVCIENWGRYRNYEAAENRIRDLEAHVVKAHESEDRATQAAGRAEARLAEAERDRAMWHRIVRKNGLCDCEEAAR